MTCMETEFIAHLSLQMVNWWYFKVSGIIGESIAVWKRGFPACLLFKASGSEHYEYCTLL